MRAKLMYYLRRIRWLWNHRDDPECNGKYRRMEYDIRWNLDRMQKKRCGGN